MELDVVEGRALSEAFPHFVIQYYSECAPFSVRHPVPNVPRQAPEVGFYLLTNNLVLPDKDSNVYLHD